MARAVVERSGNAGTRDRPDRAARKPSPKRSRWPVRLSALCLLVTLAVAVLSRALAERFWWTTLLLYLPQAVYLAPLPLLFLLSLVKRDGRALFVNGLTLALVLGPMMGWQLRFSAQPERVAEAAGGAATVRLLEYNIHGGTAGIGKLAAEVAHYRPDVVVFAEADGWGRGESLRRELAHLLPGWHSVRGSDVWVATRWPVTVALTEPLGLGHALDRSINRQKARLAVRAPFGQFHVVGVHFYTALHGHNLMRSRRRLPGYLDETAAVRMDEAKDVLRWAEELDGPVLLAGDFNTPPDGLIYRELTRPFGDCFAEAGSGWGHTYPSWWRPPGPLGRLPALPWSMLRIDYVFHSPHWTATRCEVGGREGSDHRPLFAELVLNKGR